MPSTREKYGNGKKKSVNTKPNKSALVQVGADGGASVYVSKSGARGKQAAEAKKAMERKKAGKKLLRSEELLIRKYFNPTKVRKDTPKIKRKK